ncbi:hypothetical protein DFH09DRAFT_1206060 [Mycena vulgaris]|nr:hypothetical protein DFH09DRAFT_1206060 [Mycena vulgaris]
MSQPEALQSTVRAWLDNAATRKSTLLRCVDDSHARKLVDAFQKADIDARHISQEASDAPAESIKRLARDAGLASFEAGDFPVLILARDFRVFDSPRIDCLLMALPAVTHTVLGEMIVGMAVSPDIHKEDTLVIEVVDTRKRRTGYNICDLLQLDAQDIDGQPLDVLRSRAEEKARLSLEPPTHQPVEATPPLTKAKMAKLEPDHPLVVQAAEEAKDETVKAVQDFFVGRRRRWIRCAAGIYVFDCLHHGHAIVRKSPHGLFEAYWSARRLDSDEIVRTQGVRKLSVQGSLTDVLPQVAENLGSKKDSMVPSRRYWEAKATPAQLKVLHQFCPETMEHLLYNGTPMPTADFFEWITTGDASIALARARYNPDTDAACFTLREQTVFAARINVGSKPWAEIENKKEAQKTRRILRMEMVEEARLTKKEKRVAAEAERRALREHEEADGAPPLPKIGHGNWATLSLPE